ncbi:hypothetical protein, partial [Burkholderia sp. BDU5]|uniref:hypothetical protein n=1 Tax=Burkholderia sp. BDU5 TaxID=1385590 RepID=UPI001E53D80C
ASGIRSVATPQTSSSKHGHFKRSIPKRRRLVSDLDRRSQLGGKAVGGAQSAAQSAARAAARAATSRFRMNSVKGL